MRRIFQPGESCFAAVHMRVEDDWARHCSMWENRQENRQEDKPYRGCASAQTKIANMTLAIEEIHGHHNFLLLYAADNFDPMLHEDRTTDSMKTDPTTVRISPLSPCRPSIQRAGTQ